MLGGIGELVGGSVLRTAGSILANEGAQMPDLKRTIGLRMPYWRLDCQEATGRSSLYIDRARHVRRTLLSPTGNVRCDGGADFE